MENSKMKAPSEIAFGTPVVSMPVPLDSDTLDRWNTINANNDSSSHHNVFHALSHSFA